MKVYIGIDWSENKHDVCFLDKTGEVLLVKQIRRVGVGAFSSSLRGLRLVPSKWRSRVPPRRIEPVEITSTPEAA